MSSQKRHNHGKSYRSLKMEPLEDRALLAVSIAEFEAILAAYPDLNLSGSITDYHATEVKSTVSISGQSSDDQSDWAEDFLTQYENWSGTVNLTGDKTGQKDSAKGTDSLTNRWIVSMTPEATELFPNVDAAADYLGQFGITQVTGLGMEGCLLVHISQGNVDQQAVFLSQLACLESFGADTVASVCATSITDVVNDQFASNLWGMNNINMASAWDYTTGSEEIVIAVLDTGIDTNHPDLAANIWYNPGEIPGDGIDNDGNGRVDDVNGWNFVSNTKNVFDDDGHGTHVAGTIGAVGNNGIGVVGVAQRVKLMAVKVLDHNGDGWYSDTIAGINYITYLKNRGVNIKAINASLGGTSYDSLMYRAIENAGKAGILLVAAAGNEGRNNDSYPSYPANYNLDNVISVASITSSNVLASTSNYGATTVDLAAPGASIYSTLPNGRYGNMSGTSMATPHVSGAIALAYSLNDGLNAEQVKVALLASVTPTSNLSGKTVTGGRLNAAAFLDQIPLSGYVVTTLDDQFDTNDYYQGGLSFREAIALAAASPGEDRILFQQGLTGTILLNQQLGVMQISSDLEIIGPGSELLTIDGGYVQGQSVGVPIFQTNECVVSISGLTLTRGHSSGMGGGLRADGTELTLNDVQFIGNHSNDGGGAMFLNNVMANMTDVVFINNETRGVGGAIEIRDNSSVIINQGIFDGNTASRGGAIAQNGGTLTLNRSQLLKNTANNLHGGALYLAGENFYAINTLIAQNAALPYGNYSSQGGGIYVNSGHATLTNVTITDNLADFGVGICCIVTNGITINNSVLAGNKATGNAPNSIDGLGEFQGAHNLIGAGNGVHGLVDGIDGNIVGTISQPIDPLFIDAANGDYRLAANSPAINTGDNALAVDNAGNPIQYDLNGRMRIFNQIVDMGAFESFNRIIVDTLLDIVDTNDGVTSLREAVRLAEQGGEASTIVFDMSLFEYEPQFIYMNNTTITAASTNVTIIGPGTDLLTIVTPNGRDIRGFEFNHCVVTMFGMTISGAMDMSPYGSGGIYATDSDLTLDNMALVNSKAYRGAVIEAIASVLTITHTEITDNYTLQFRDENNSYDYGSIIRTRDAVSTTISNCLLSNENLYFNNIYATTGIEQIGGGNLTVTDSVVSHVYGNGISLRYNNGLLTVTNCIVNNNRVGIYTLDANAVVSDSTITGNSSSIYDSGHGIFVDSSTRQHYGDIEGAILPRLILKDSIISNNGSSFGSSNSGGIYVIGIADIDNCTISGNGRRGVYVQGGLLINDSIVSENGGGGIYQDNRFGYSLQRVLDFDNVISNCRIIDNSMEYYSSGDSDGGGVFCRGNMSVINTLIARNTAYNFGSGIYVAGNTTLNIIHSTVTQNGSPYQIGSGIEGNSSYATINLFNSIVAGNGSSDVFGKFGIVSHSLVGNTNFSHSLQYHGQNGSFVGNYTDSIDAMLDENYIPMANSPAVDAGSDEFVTEGRIIFGNGVDMGLFESNHSVIWVDSIGDITVDGKNTLRDAIAIANVKEDHDTIRFRNEALIDTITLTRGEIAIKSNVTIIGAGVTINGNGLSRIFNIAGTSRNLIDVTVTGLSLIGGYHKNNGGAVYTTYANTSWNNVTFANSTALYGGAFYQNNSLATFNNASFFDNNATYGGAFYLAGGNVNFASDSRFENNNATWGGGVYVLKGDLVMMDVTLVKNEAKWGGGVYLAGGNATLTDTMFSGNTAAPKYGSGIAKTNKSQLKIIKNNNVILETALAEYLDESRL